MRVRIVGTMVALVVGVLGVGCDDGRAATSSTAPVRSTTTAPTTTEPVGPLRVLVTNDDGIGAPGIAAVSDALAALDGVEVVVVAPAQNQSGSGGTTTPGDLVVTAGATATGRAGTAVAGYPADAVRWALDGGLDERPDLVVSGINAGQNLGRFVPTSGTIGAARAAAARGVPALAASQGLGEPPDYAAGVAQVVAWFDEHRAAVAAGRLAPGVTSLNIPTCTAGAVRGVAEVPVVAYSGQEEVAPSDCTSTLVGPADDVTAFRNGFATISDVGLG